MKQYQFQDWADYVRGVAGPERELEMGEALQRGDAESIRLCELAQKVRGSAEFLAGPEVPETVLNRAKTIFKRGERESMLRLPLAPMRLLFDSLLEAQPAGLRSGGALHRETAHQAEEYHLSLRVEQEAGTELFAVVGQLAMEGDKGGTVGKRPVFVYQREKLVARTLSADSGEFQMEFLGREPLKLVVLVDSPERRIELDLVPENGKKQKRY